MQVSTYILYVCYKSMSKQYIVTKVLLEVEDNDSIVLSDMTISKVVKYDDEHASVRGDDIAKGLKLFNAYSMSCEEVVDTQVHNAPREINVFSEGEVTKQLYPFADTECTVCNRIGAYSSVKGSNEPSICLLCRLKMNEDKQVQYVISR